MRGIGNCDVLTKIYFLQDKKIDNLYSFAKDIQKINIGTGDNDYTIGAYLKILKDFVEKDILIKQNGESHKHSTGKPVHYYKLDKKAALKELLTYPHIQYFVNILRQEGFIIWALGSKIGDIEQKIPKVYYGR